jgi:hypothetical protein
MDARRRPIRNARRASGRGSPRDSPGLGGAAGREARTVETPRSVRYCVRGPQMVPRQSGPRDAHAPGPHQENDCPFISHCSQLGVRFRLSDGTVRTVVRRATRLGA